jgi:predicted secreted hydrolase
MIGRLLFAATLILFTAAADRSDIAFPRDHGAHSDAPVEWWYYTGHLKDAETHEFGFQLTFFRVRQMHLAHFAWSDAARGSFRYEEKTHLELPGIASAAVGRLAVANEDWSAEESGGTHRLHAAGRGWELSLALKAVKPPVVHGAGGLSRKGPGGNEYSRYVSITRLAAAGTMRNGPATVSLSGTAWFDHEWGPGALPEGAAGWDWFALQLDDGADLMLYRMRALGGGATAFSSGTFVPASGEPRTIVWQDVTLEEKVFWKSPRSGARYPGKWRLAVASLGLDVVVEPLIPDQELVTEKSTGVTYWEGACRVRGARSGKPVSGRAYAELTGYARRDVPGFPSSGPTAVKGSAWAWAWALPRAPSSPESP